jgi:NAD(P)-dependent dehydrogenase (short-subunit alcohol dehydrogenase family)
MSLQGKRVLITGAAGGLGSATMVALARAGCKVVGIDKRPGNGLSLDDIMVADLTNKTQLKDAVTAAVGRLSGLDILINNAGVFDLQDPGIAPDDGSLEHFEVNTFAAWRTTAAALPALLAARGRVINMTSLFAVVNAPFIPAYCASKRALVAYSDILRMQYGDRISVTTVYPGYIATPIHDKSVRQGFSVARLVAFKLGRRTLLNFEVPLETAARGMVRICRGRPGRDRALTFFDSISLFWARHMPSLVDGVMRRRVNQLIRDGMQVHLENA